MSGAILIQSVNQLLVCETMRFNDDTRIMTCPTRIKARLCRKLANHMESGEAVRQEQRVDVGGPYPCVDRN